MIFVQEILDGIDNLRNLCIDSETEVCSELCPNDKCAVQILYNKLIKHGRWKDCKCTQCEGDAPFWAMTSAYYRSRYCPHCGARMDEME